MFPMAGASEDDLIDNTASAVGAAAAAPGRPGSGGRAAAAVASAVAPVSAPSRPISKSPQQIDAAALEKLPAALDTLFRKRQSVCNLDAVRHALMSCDYSLYDCVTEKIELIHGSRHGIYECVSECMM